jgi:hypothetical protein
VSLVARPFHLPGRQQLDAIGARVQQTLPELARDWWGENGRVQLVAVEPWSDELRSSAVRAVVREDTDRWLCFIGPEQAWLKLAEGWLGCEVHAPGPLVDLLLRELCLAIYRQVAASSGAAAVLEDGGWSLVSPASLAAHVGTVVIELDIDGVPLTLVGPSSLWSEADAWPAMREGARTQPVSEALADTRVRIDVRLPEVRVPMADVTELAVGDFLDLEHDVSGRVRVIAQGVALELTGQLGQADGCRAAKIIGTQ